MAEAQESLRREWFYASDLLPEVAEKLFQRYAAQFRVAEDIVEDAPRYEDGCDRVPSAFVDVHTPLAFEDAGDDERKSRLVKRNVSPHAAKQRPRTAYTPPDHYGAHKPQPQAHVLQV